MKIAIICDHTGYDLKEFLIKALSAKHQLIDLQNDKPLKSNYASLGMQIGDYVAKQKDVLGIAICGTGIGISIAVNKVKGTICALCNDVLSARYAKMHNNANVVALGARMIAKEKALEIINEFLITKFEGGRHLERIKLLLES